MIMHFTLARSADSPVFFLYANVILSIIFAFYFGWNMALAHKNFEDTGIKSELKRAWDISFIFISSIIFGGLPTAILYGAFVFLVILHSYLKVIRDYLKHLM